MHMLQRVVEQCIRLQAMQWNPYNFMKWIRIGIGIYAHVRKDCMCMRLLVFVCLVHENLYI